MKMHDIFPMVTIANYSLYYVVLSFLFILILVIVFIIYRHLKYKKIRTYLSILEACDMEDAKRTAQQFSYYAKRLSKTEQQKSHYHSLYLLLSTYKYTKTSFALPLSIQKEIQVFLACIRKENV